ncbi:MAG: prepilin-type N-terminal cleavage/methylation domain-containing protein [Mariprofundaceae bacterium]|nr:prepilin-type N-terminal cleavage/methylation domain-containing protein [Mariprofundaceae bacterium]
MQYDSSSRGFTLIELMITLVIGLVLLAGVLSVFIGNTRLSAALADRTERLGDLYTASHIMQTELRRAQSTATSIPAGSTSTITYTPADSTCVGSFTFRANPTTATVHEIAWKRPEKVPGPGVPPGTCNNNTAQLIRDLDPTKGMSISALTSDIYGNPVLLGVDLYSLYFNQDHVTKTVSLSFKVWIRN